MVDSQLICCIGGFRSLIPYAESNNTRFVFVNRPDFPGSDPYTEDERQQLVLAQDSAEAQATLLKFMADRAWELYDFLVRFVAQEDIPVANGSKGGLMLVAWSFGSTWLTAFLSNLTKFPVNDVDLSPYIRRTILYGMHTLCSVRLRGING